VARLKSKKYQTLENKFGEESTHSAKPSSSQVCTSIALLKFLISLFASNPQLWKFYIGISNATSFETYDHAHVLSVDARIVEFAEVAPCCSGSIATTSHVWQKMSRIA
jgi:hypothetical protein